MRLACEIFWSCRWLLLDVVSGGDDSQQRRFVDWLSHDERHSWTGEFLHIVNSVEEAYWYAEGVLPILRAEGVLAA